MTLRRRTLLAIIIAMIGMITVLYGVLHVVMAETFVTLDSQAALRNVDRAVNAFQDKVANLSRVVQDWSNWDELYRFMQDGNHAFIETNLSDDTLWSLDVNLMLFVDDANEVVYAKALDVHPDWQNNILPELERYMDNDPMFVRLTMSIPTSGFVVIGDAPLLIASRHVFHSDGTGPRAGTVIFGKHFAEEELALLGRSLRLSLYFNSIRAPNLSEDILAAKDTLSPASLRTTAMLDEQTIAAYTYVNDIYGRQSLILRTTQDRSAYQQGMPSLLTILAALTLCGVLFGALLLLLLERLFLGRFASISDGLRDALLRDDFTHRLPAEGKDDLTRFANNLNTIMMLVTHSRSEMEQSNTRLKIEGNTRASELERQKLHLQTMIEGMGEGVVYCVNGRINYVNHAFVNMLNFEADELIGKSFAVLNAQADPDETLSFVMTPRRYEARLTRRDGSNINAEIVSTPIEQGDKQHSQVMIIRDVTEALALRQKKDYFFARASHDLRSPLTSIMTRLYLLGKRPDQLETHLKVLNHVSNHMLELVNDLLDVSRFERGANVLKRRDLVLQALVDQVIEVQQADAEIKQITLKAQAVELPLHVYGDPTRLHQVVNNLVSNAIRYTPEGGSILVDVGLEYHNGEKCALIKISDTGIGIDTEHQIHIFDPFFRVNNEYEGGSGLGLFIVREIVQLHGGEVYVSSEPGEGTTFFVRLTLSSPQTNAERIPSGSSRLA